MTRRAEHYKVFGESNVVIDEQSIELLCFQIFAVVYTRCYISYGQTFAANYLMAHNSLDTCCIVGRHTGLLCKHRSEILTTVETAPETSGGGSGRRESSVSLIALPSS